MKKLLSHWNNKRRSIYQIIACSLEWCTAINVLFFKEVILFDLNKDNHVISFIDTIVLFPILSCLLLIIYSKGTFEEEESDYYNLFPYMKAKAFTIDSFSIALPLWISLGGILRLAVLIVFGKEIHLTGRQIFIFVILLAVTVYLFVLGMMAVMPTLYYDDIEKEIIHKNGRYLDMWFSISDKRNVSSYSLLPYIVFFKIDYIENASILFCSSEIDLFSEQNNAAISFSDFYRCLIYLSEQQKNDNILLWIRRLGKTPHISVLFAFEHKKAYISYKDEIDELKKSNPVSLLFLPRPVYDIQTLSDHLKNYKLDKGIQFVDPVRTISWSNNLCNIYYNIYRAPKIVRIMIRKVFHELEPLAGLYAMFDLIDFMNRLVFAFYAPDNIEWYQRESNSRKIGNLLAMMSYIEEKGAEILGYEYPKSFKRHTRYAGKRNVVVDQVFTDEQKEIIKHYLVKYEFPVSGKMNYGDITYICANIRNAIRGHGNVSYRDIPMLQKLVFTLFLLDYYILEIDKMFFSDKYSFGSAYVMGEHLDGTYIMGEYGQYKDIMIPCYDEHKHQKNRDPEFIIMMDDKLLLFNNCIKNNEKGKHAYSWEYIDYISGEIIKPSFKKIEK